MLYNRHFEVWINFQSSWLLHFALYITTLLLRSSIPDVLNVRNILQRTRWAICPRISKKRNAPRPWFVLKILSCQVYDQDECNIVCSIFSQVHTVWGRSTFESHVPALGCTVHWRCAACWTRTCWTPVLKFFLPLTNRCCTSTLINSIGQIECWWVMEERNFQSGILSSSCRFKLKDQPSSAATLKKQVFGTAYLDQDPVLESIRFWQYFWTTRMSVIHHGKHSPSTLSKSVASNV